MNFNILVPITFLVCTVCTIKIAVDALLHRHMVNAGSSPEMINSILRAEEQRRRYSSLRWGIVLLSVGLGFAIIQWIDWREITPGAIAVLASATAAGNLVFFAISRKLKAA